MATRLINHLCEGGPSSCATSVGSWVVPRHKHIGSLLETVVIQRTWLFHVWLTVVRINRRHDLTFCLNPQLYKNSLVDCQNEHALMHG